MIRTSLKILSVRPFNVCCDFLTLRRWKGPRVKMLFGEMLFPAARELTMVPKGERSCRMFAAKCGPVKPALCMKAAEGRGAASEHRKGGGGRGGGV